MLVVKWSQSMTNELIARVCQENEVLEQDVDEYLLELIHAPKVSGGMGLTGLLGREVRSEWVLGYNWRLKCWIRVVKVFCLWVVWWLWARKEMWSSFYQDGTFEFQTSGYLQKQWKQHLLCGIKDTGHPFCSSLFSSSIFGLWATRNVAYPLWWSYH